VTGNILVDDPRFFECCGRMELIGQDEYIECLKEDDVPKEELDSVKD